MKWHVGIASVFRRYCVGAIFAFPAAAQSEPWQGTWTADPDWCAYADLIGSHTPAPIRLTENAFLGYENSCDLTSTENVTENGWVLDLECTAEGSTYQERRIVMVAGDRMYMWLGQEKPIQFTRCAE